MIEFSQDPNIRPWSIGIFWFAAVNLVATVGFTLVVIVGGIMDLKFLFHALKNPSADEEKPPQRPAITKD